MYPNKMSVSDYVQSNTLRMKTSPFAGDGRSVILWKESENKESITLQNRLETAKQ